MLAHEGAHVADGGPPTAAGELAARTAELEACGRLFGGDVQPNWAAPTRPPCCRATTRAALRRLKEAGYR